MRPNDDVEPTETDGTPFDVVTRRQLVGAIAAGCVGMAGCSGDSGSDTATGTPTASETPLATTTTARGTGSPGDSPGTPGAAVEPTFDFSPQSKKPSEWDLSPYSDLFSARNSPLAPTLAPFGANATHPEREYMPILMADHEVIEDGTVWRNTLAEGFRWHDGEAVTIDDRYYKARYDMLRRRKLGEPTFEAIERVDDRTLELELARPRVPATFIAEQIPWIRHKGSLYEPYVESLEDTTSAREAYLTHEEVKDISISIEDWAGNGLFRVSEVTPEAVHFEQYEEFPERFRRNQNIEEVRVPIIPEGGNEDQFIADEVTDWNNFHVKPIDVPGTSSRPDRYRLAIRPSTEQYKLRLNHANPHLKRRGVRRAMAYLQNWGELLEDPYLPLSHPEPVQDGMPSVTGRLWVPDYEERTSEYIDYGRLSRPEKAKAELQRAGYELRGDSDAEWVDSNGEALSFVIESDNNIFGDREEVTRWFWQFDMNAGYEENVSWYDAWTKREVDWDAFYAFHCRGPDMYDSFHPEAAYRDDPKWGLVMTRTDEDGNRQPASNRQLEYELPTEIGATDLSGETRMVNVPDLQDRLADPATPHEELVETVRTLSWWWNFYVPDIVCVGWMDHFTGDFESFEWRDWDGDGHGDARNHHQLSVSLNTGYVRGKQA